MNSVLRLSESLVFITSVAHQVSSVQPELNYCCLQVHQRKTLCANVKRTTIESVQTPSVNPPKSEYSNIYELLAHALLPLPCGVCEGFY